MLVVLPQIHTSLTQTGTHQQLQIPFILNKIRQKEQQLTLKINNHHRENPCNANQQITNILMLLGFFQLFSFSFFFQNKIK